MASQGTAKRKTELNEYNTLITKWTYLAMVPWSETLNWCHQIPNLPEPNYSAVQRGFSYIFSRWANY